MDVEPKQGRTGIRRKLRRKRHKLLVIELMQDFAKNTTLHGLRYITERGLSLVEKLFWIITFLISISLCLYLIRNVWVKWQTSPVVVVLSEHLVSVREVPFPSVTICPQIKAKRSVYNFSAETIKVKERITNRFNWTDETKPEADKFEDIGIICWVEDLMYAYPKRDYSDEKIIDHIIEVSPTVDDVFWSCFWQTQKFSCSWMFKPVLTMEGVCFTTNSLAATEIFKGENIQSDYNYLNTSQRSKGWSPIEGYTSPEANVYPRRGRGNGVNPDLYLILQEQLSDRDGLCNAINHGYKVYLQHPADMPQSSLYYYAAVPKQTSSFALKFSILNTSSSLMNYRPEIRQCYFPAERQLRYFKTYTANNCRLECLSNYTFSQCGCVWFHMPHHNSSTICRKAKWDCVSDAIEIYATEQGRSNSDANTAGCSCLPSCVGIQYDAEVLKTKFDTINYMDTVKSIFPELFDPDPSDDEKHLTQIEVYYKEPQFVSMRRSELFGLTDFLANCGGLLGLFLGFSFLSLVEIVYFLTLRLGFTFGRDMLEHRRRSGTEEDKSI